MQVCKLGSLIAGVVLLLGTSVTYSAPQPAGISYYSAGLTSQLFGEIPSWPASVEEAQAGIDAAALFVPKEETYSNRVDADLHMTIAAMMRDPEAGVRDHSTQGVAAWEQLLQSNDSDDSDMARLEALEKRMHEFELSFKVQHDKQAISFKEQADLRMTCAQSVQSAVQHTNANYAIAQAENAALRGVYFEMQGVIRSFLAREARWAVAYKALSPAHQIPQQSNMADRQNESFTAIHMAAQDVGESLESEVKPWVLGHNGLKKLGSCSS